MRTSSRLAALLAVVLLAVAGCGGDDEGSGASATTQAQQLKVAMALPGAINDQGFNQSAYAGLEACKQNGAQTAFKEKIPPPQFESSLETFARDNDVVIGHGFEWGEPVGKVAPEHSDVKWVVTSNPLKPAAPNVVHAIINSTQGAYLAGVVAGAATESDKIAGVGGLKFPVLEAQMAAYEAGAKSVNPDVTMQTVWLGTFDDAAKGREAAQSLAAEDVDVVYHIADAAGVGVINGAEAAKIKAIGWGLDQNSVAPQTVVASQIVDTTKQIADLCKELQANGAQPAAEFGGKVDVDGLRSGNIGISKLYNLPATVQTEVDEAKQAIEDGTAKVPSIGGDIPGSGPESG
jgi:basic membrane protein A and related proteins